MTIPERLQRLWDRVPETRVEMLSRFHDETRWEWRGYAMPDDQAHDLAAGPIERWLTKWPEFEGVLSIAYWQHGIEVYSDEGHGEHSNCSLAPTKLEALLAAAERVAGITPA